MKTRVYILRKLMREANLDAILISSIPNIFYLTEFSNFSTEDRDAFILITNNKQYIFTHGIYKQAVKKFIKNFDLIEMLRDKPLNKSLDILIKKHKIKSLGIEEFDLKVKEYKNILKFVNKKSIKPVTLVNNLRKIKSDKEINKIKKACVLGDKIYSQVLKYLKIGATEKNIAYKIDDLIRKNIAEPSFPTIVAFGQNAAYPHHVPTDKKLTKNTFALMDFGVRLDNYCSDMTRTIFFGKATRKERNAYQAVLESQNKAVEQFNNLAMKQSPNVGITASNMDKASRAHIISKGFPTIPHSLGHGIGLEVHEDPRLSPNSKDTLENGMVFSIEPGIYLPGKFGIRIEDLFAIQNNKLLALTRSPKELTEI